MGGGKMRVVRKPRGQGSRPYTYLSWHRDWQMSSEYGLPGFYRQYPTVPLLLFTSLIWEEGPHPLHYIRNIGGAP